MQKKIFQENSSIDLRKDADFFSNQIFMYHEALIIWSTYIPKSWLNNESKMHNKERENPTWQMHDEKVKKVTMTL